ncbi:MAG: CPBP family intramembrane metalloprotease [Nitrososphaeria archaeon]|nr:CPBP family intramembrane metalloprotease [Nitrososphaeria archaeon]
MDPPIVKGLLYYIISAYLLAFLVDILALHIITNYPLTSMTTILIWGLIRMYTPTLASIIGLKVLGKNVVYEIKGFLGQIKNVLTLKWYFLSPLITFASLGIYILFSMIFGFFNLTTLIEQTEALQNILSPETNQTTLLIIIILSMILSSYIAAITLNAIFALGEEIGWRGFLVNLLLEKIGFLKTSIIVGILWGLWHATAILFLGHNYQVHRIEGVILFTIITILFTFPHIFVRNSSKSVLPAASLHGSINALWGFTLLITKSADNEIFGGLGFLGIFTWLITSLLLTYVYKRKNSKANFMKSL